MACSKRRPTSFSTSSPAACAVAFIDRGQMVDVGQHHTQRALVPDRSRDLPLQHFHDRGPVRQPRQLVANRMRAKGFPGQCQVRFLAFQCLVARKQTQTAAFAAHRGGAGSGPTPSPTRRKKTMLQWRARALSSAREYGRDGRLPATACQAAHGQCPSPGHAREIRAMSRPNPISRFFGIPAADKRAFAGFLPGDGPLLPAKYRKLRQSDPF